ncbi:MAG: hypothetical protein IJQ21_08635 [Lachnospiraceae bacterium]|nr:hypothetical protein [Lachnospiraceae bacterium]
MHCNLTVFGAKDSSEIIIEYISGGLATIDLVVTVSEGVKCRNEISGVANTLQALCKRLDIQVFEADSYMLDDEASRAFFKENTFDLGIVVGWQRLIPAHVLNAFQNGIFGFHGNAGYLPFGRGRSPLNWSLLLGDTRFNLNLFRYDEQADSPNVFAKEMFQLSAHDNIRTAGYKNLICQKRLVAKLLACHSEGNEIPVHTESKDFDSWYEKRTAADGKIDFHARTREIYNLIRAVASPFPGAFCYADGKEVRVWEAHPFDEILDFSGYAPGEVADVFDEKPVVRTVDGSLLIDRYESEVTLLPGMLLT